MSLRTELLYFSGLSRMGKWGYEGICSQAMPPRLTLVGERRASLVGFWRSRRRVGLVARESFVEAFGQYELSLRALDPEGL